MKKNRSGLLLEAMVLSLLVLAGCGSSTKSGSDAARDAAARATFSWLETNVFQLACNKCHGGAHPAHKVDLTTYTGAIAAEINKPGDPEKSSLFTEVASGDMPLHGAKLADTQIQAIYDWIKAGSQNN